MTDVARRGQNTSRDINRIRRDISPKGECCEADSLTYGDRATSQTSPHFIRRDIEVVITRRS